MDKKVDAFFRFECVTIIAELSYAVDDGIQHAQVIRARDNCFFTVNIYF